MLTQFSIYAPVGFDGRAPFSPITTEQARMIQNVRMILGTEQGEWPMDPLKGCNLRSFLDEPADDLTVRLVRASIKRQIQKYEPAARVELVTPTITEAGNLIHLRLEILLSSLLFPSLISIEAGASYQV